MFWPHHSSVASPQRSRHSSSPSQCGPSKAIGAPAPSHVPLDPIAQKQQTGLLEQLELQKKLDAQLLQQRNTQSALDLRMHTAGPGPTLRPAQLQRLARHVLIMRGMLQHLLTLLHAVTVDFCAAGQFAQRSFASGPTQVQPHVHTGATEVPQRCRRGASEMPAAERLQRTEQSGMLPGMRASFQSPLTRTQTRLPEGCPGGYPQGCPEGSDPDPDFCPCP